MKIKKMTATFGRLERAVLEPGSGLTIVFAPNEAGKSTWAAFLRAMLYGINTRERDKEGYLAEKNRYAPWSGAPMEGELQVEWQEKDITIRRFTKRSPFDGFEAVYTAGGDPVPGLTAENVGELLIGAGRELYERSAFVGQGGTVIGGSDELERRITALATAGEEGVSFTEAQRTLKNWLNRRRANKANGILPELDEELLSIRTALEELEDSEREWNEAEERRKELEREKGGLEAEMELHRRIRQQELDRRYGRAKRDWEQAVQAIPQTGGHPLFGSMTADEAWACAQERVEVQRAAEEENRRRETVRAELTRKETRCRVFSRIWLVLLVAALPFLGLSLVRVNWYSAIVLGMVALSAVLNLLAMSRQRKKLTKERGDLAPVEVPDAGDVLEQAASYREALAKEEQAAAAAQAAKRLVDELAVQGGREFTTLELLHAPDRTPEETERTLRRVEQELTNVRRRLDMVRGKRAMLGEPDKLYARLDQCSADRAERQREYDAIAIAMEALSEANDTLRQRFSPELNRQAGELFARLTGGEYAALALTRRLEASATPAGEVMPRSALALSRGAVEQLYLAVRLAVCELTLGSEDAPPMLLDDALTNFDDRRMELALRLLLELSGKRQILLFTCHSREQEWAVKHGGGIACRFMG